MRFTLISRSILWYSKIAKVKIQWQYFFFIRKRNADIFRSVFQAKFHLVMFFCFQPILWNRCANCRPCGWSNICFSSGYVLEDMSITCLYKWSSVETCIQYNDVKVNRCWEYMEFIFLMFFGDNKTPDLVFLKTFLDCNVCILIWSWSVCSGLYQDEDHGSLLDRSPRWWIGAAPQDTFQHKPPDRSRLPQTPRPTGKTQCQQNVMRIENDTVNRVPKIWPSFTLESMPCFMF